MAIRLPVLLCQVERVCVNCRFVLPSGIQCISESHLLSASSLHVEATPAVCSIQPDLRCHYPYGQIAEESTRLTHNMVVSHKLQFAPLLLSIFQRVSSSYHYSQFSQAPIRLTIIANLPRCPLVLSLWSIHPSANSSYYYSKFA